jgi:predicted TIM-barrel fold metal-dependent hydrolase
MSGEVQTVEAQVEESRALTLVDCDIHPMPATRDLIDKHLSDRWRNRVERFGTRTPWTPNYPRPVHRGTRADITVHGPGFGVFLDQVQADVLDTYEVDYGVLILWNFYDREERDLCADGSRASNDWLIEDWLEPEPRLLGSMVVPWEYPELAVREIERRAAEPWWAQVYMMGETLEPLGSRKYWPIYEAATAAGLPVATHPGAYELHLGAGWPSYYFEEHVGYTLGVRRQLLSMVSSGLFEAVPGVRIVVAEGGVMWSVSLRWAVDSAAELLGDELGLDRRPSEYLDGHVWFTTQPVEEPDDEKDYARALAHGNLAGRMLFSSDYPHWDFDSPKQALPRCLDEKTRRRIFAGNASDLYNLPRAR